MRIIVKTLIIICLFFVLLISSAYFVRVVIYKNKSDPLEQAISQALDNSRLVLGSSLKEWFKELGKPDLILIGNWPYEFTQIFWLKNGIAVEVDGSLDLQSGSESNKKVMAIILPLREKVPQDFIKSRRILSNTKNISEIRFQNLLDARIESAKIRDMTELQISELYDNYDASEDFLYNLPLLFSKSIVSFYRGPEYQGCARAFCEDNIDLIEIRYVNMFDVFYLINFIRRPF